MISPDELQFQFPLQIYQTKFQNQECVLCLQNCKSGFVFAGWVNICVLKYLKYLTCLKLQTDNLLSFTKQVGCIIGVHNTLFYVPMYTFYPLISRLMNTHGLCIQVGYLTYIHTRDVQKPFPDLIIYMVSHKRHQILKRLQGFPYKTQDSFSIFHH